MNLLEYKKLHIQKNILIEIKKKYLMIQRELVEVFGRRRREDEDETKKKWLRSLISVDYERKKS